MSRHAPVSKIKRMTTKYSSPARYISVKMCLNALLATICLYFPINIYFLQKICLTYKESNFLPLINFSRPCKHAWNYKKAIGASLPEFAVRQCSPIVA